MLAATALGLTESRIICILTDEFIFPRLSLAYTVILYNPSLNAVTFHVALKYLLLILSPADALVASSIAT